MNTGIPSSITKAFNISQPKMEEDQNDFDSTAIDQAADRAIGQTRDQISANEMAGVGQAGQALQRAPEDINAAAASLAMNQPKDFAAALQRRSQEKLKDRTGELKLSSDLNAYDKQAKGLERSARHMQQKTALNIQKWERRMKRDADRKASRSNAIGSILGLVGTGVGAFMGGPAGAAVGSQLGSSIGSNA